MLFDVHRQSLIYSWWDGPIHGQEERPQPSGEWWWETLGWQLWTSADPNMIRLTVKHFYAAYQTLDFHLATQIAFEVVECEFPRFGISLFIPPHEEVCSWGRKNGLEYVSTVIIWNIVEAPPFDTFQRRHLILDTKQTWSLTSHLHTQPRNYTMPGIILYLTKSQYSDQYLPYFFLQRSSSRKARSVNKIVR